MKTHELMQVGWFGADIVCIASLFVIAIQSFQMLFDENSTKPKQTREKISLTALIINLVIMIYFISIFLYDRLVVRGVIPFLLFLLISIHSILLFFAITWQTWRIQGKRTLWIRETKRFIFAPLIFTTVIALVFLMFLEIPYQFSKISVLFHTSHIPLPPSKHLKKKKNRTK